MERVLTKNNPPQAAVPLGRADRQVFSSASAVVFIEFAGVKLDFKLANAVD
jgi:hypothetical protein